MVKRLLVCAVALAGCEYVTSSFETNDFSGDPFPTQVDTSSGAIVVGLREAGSNGDRQAVLEVMSPMTVIDRGADAPASIETTDLTLLGARGPGGPLDLPRATFLAKEVVTLHPCHPAECTIGDDTTQLPFNAVLGAPTFAGDALRLRLADDSIFVLPDVAGSDDRRGRVCDAVMDSPFRGGGTLVLGGTEVSFQNWRIAIAACIKPHPARLLTQSARGLDVLLVMSTAIGPSLLSRTAYEHFRELEPTLPPADMLPQRGALLPSGPIAGGYTTLPSIALVSNSGSNPRAPCRQMWASHLLAERDCVPGDDCPCTGGDKFCAVPAMVEMQPTTGIPVLVVADTEPTLQALRTELRPDQPEVDGILGTQAIEALELDIDYGHDRLLARCVDRTTCGARAALPDRTARKYVNDCLDGAPGPIVLEDN
jgi:hypothetical protein